MVVAVAEASLGSVLGGIFGGAITSNPAGIALGSAAGNFIGDLISGNQSSVAVTAAQAGLLSGGFAGPVTSTGTSVGPATVSPVFGGFGGIQPIVSALPRVIAPVVGSAIGSVIADQFLAAPGRGDVVARAPISPVTGSMRTMTRRQFILASARAANPGATAKKIIRTARQCGIDLAAATFGLDAMSICFLIAETPTRRRRGISAADITRTRATIRKVNSLKELCPPATRRRRK